jgi:hypothetical protein
MILKSRKKPVPLFYLRQDRWHQDFFSEGRRKLYETLANFLSDSEIPLAPDAKSFVDKWRKIPPLAAAVAQQSW